MSFKMAGVLVISTILGMIAAISGEVIIFKQLDRWESTISFVFGVCLFLGGIGLTTFVLIYLNLFHEEENEN